MSIIGNTIGFPLPDPRKGMDMVGNRISNLANPLNPGDAVNKKYFDEVVDRFVETLESARVSYVVTLKADKWTDKIQNVLIEKATADVTKTDIFVSPDPDEENVATYADCNVRLVKQLDGEISFRCEDVPERDLAVNVVVFA